MTPAPSRGFTLLEVMLAAMLGAMVVVVCVGLFAAIDRQTLDGRQRFTETLEIGLTHETAERAFQMLVMSDSAPPPPAAGTRPRNDREEPEQPLTPAEPPRLLVEFDTRHVGSMTAFDAGGNQRRIPPQRVEVALRAPPVFVPQSLRREAQAQESRRSRRERERAAAALAADADPALAAAAIMDTTVAPGLRGTFELEHHPAPPGARGYPPDGTWSLWWRQHGVHASPDDPLVLGGMTPGRIRLASDLVRVHWQVFRGGQWRDEWSATWMDDLPAYIQLEIETVRGTNNQWLFEVGWTTGKDPGSIIAQRRAADPADGARSPRPGEATPLPDGADPQRGPGAGQRTRGTPDRSEGR